MLTKTYFPFTPGLAWRVKNKKFILPKVNKTDIDNFIFNKRNVIVGFGGFIESYVSLFLIEYLNIYFPKNKIEFVCNNYFNSLYLSQGLSEKSEISLQKNILNQYPIPIFADADDNIYFNYLNNYLNVYTIFGKLSYQSQKALLKQIFPNFLYDIDISYVPKFRNMFNIKYNDWAKIVGFNDKKPYFVIFPDKSRYSIHEEGNFLWTPGQIRAFSAMMQTLSIPVVLFTDNKNLYYGQNIYTPPNEVDIIMSLVSRCKFLLSYSPDFSLFCAMENFKAHILTFKKLKKYNLVENLKFLNAKTDNLLILNKKMSVLDVFNEIQRII